MEPAPQRKPLRALLHSGASHAGPLSGIERISGSAVLLAQSGKFLLNAVHNVSADFSLVLFVNDHRLFADTGLLFSRKRVHLEAGRLDLAPCPVALRPLMGRARATSESAICA